MYESGFSEEFHRARDRYRETGSPEIWLAFKHVDGAIQADAGPQLTQVLNFKQEQISVREFLFKEFTEVIEFERRLRNWVENYIFSRLLPAQPSGETGPSTQAVVDLQMPPRDVDASSKSQLAVPADLADSAERILSVLHQPEFEAYWDAGFALSNIDLARMLLHLKAWLWLSYGGEALSVHEINLLYQHRGDVRLVFPENIFCLRIVAGEASDVTPGWFWFRNHTTENCVSQMVFAIVRDHDVPHGSRMINLLEAGGVVLEQDQLDDLMESAKSEGKLEVARALASYIGGVGDERHLSLLERPEFAERSELTADLTAARLRVLARQDLQRAVDAAIATGTEIPDPVLEMIELQGDSVSVAALSTLSRQATDKVRLVATSTLIRRGELGEEALRSLLSDKSSAVRAAICAALVEGGAGIEINDIRKCLESTNLGLTLMGMSATPQPEQLIVAQMRRLPQEALEGQIEWLKPDGALAYQALGLEYFASVQSRIRRDLADNFSELERQWVESMRARIIEDLGQLSGSERARAQQIVDSKISEMIDPALREFIRSRYIEAALRVLAEKGEPADADYARRHLKPNSGIRQWGTIRLLSRFGIASDAGTLIAVAKASFGEDRDEAIRGALSLAPGPEGAAKAFLESDDPAFVAPALRALTEHSVSEVVPFVEPMLGSKRDDIRVLAVAFLAEKLSRGDLESLMVTYREGLYYYYNVGCWLDRVLYAPSPFCEVFRKRLASKLPG
ncbi:MAG: hypothetical protein ABSA52_05465 [Candidatus Binatia bacterium]